MGLCFGVSMLLPDEGGQEGGGPGWPPDDVAKIFPVCPLSNLMGVPTAIRTGLLRLVWLQLAIPPALTFAQSLPAVPPLPQQERLVERSDLTGTLRASSLEISAGEVPQLTLVLTNQSTKRLRAPNAVIDLNVSIQVFDSDGMQVQPRLNAILEWRMFPTSVRTLPLLAAGRSTESALSLGQNAPLALPVGEYVYRVTYVSRAGWPSIYDVYERGADEVWEGELSASVAIRVRPVDAASKQRLTEQVRNGSRTDAEAAMRILGLSRATDAVDAIVERLDREHSTFPVALESLGYIQAPSAARAVAAVRGRMPMEIRYGASSIAIPVMWAQRDIFELVRAAGCEGLTLGSLIIASPQSAEHLRSVCPRVTDLVRAEAISQPAQTLTREEADRRQWAVSMLKWLETPSSPAPTVYPHDRFPAAPTVERLREYVAAVIGFPGGHTERVKVEVSGIARFGTHDTFRQLRKALNTADGESGEAINQALQALAFEDEIHGPSDRAEEVRRWDRWWQQHGGQSREQWAREAIGKRPAVSGDSYEVTGASRAAEYLLVLDRGRYEQRLVTHPSWQVRVVAAITLAPKEPQYAAALLLREFENRYLSACFNAGNQLASLTGSWFPFQCSRPEERRAAAAHWTGLALAR